MEIFKLWTKNAKIVTILNKPEGRFIAHFTTHTLSMQMLRLVMNFNQNNAKNEEKWQFWE